MTDSVAVRWVMSELCWSEQRARHAVEWMDRNVPDWCWLDEIADHAHEIARDYYRAEFDADHDPSGRGRATAA